MRNLNLPARMSPCLRVFIELLLDDPKELAVLRESRERDSEPALPLAIERQQFKRADLRSGI